METKERKNTNTSKIRLNTGKVVEHPEIKFGGKKYYTQFISNGEKKYIFA